jgi:hypothetical protein
MAHAVACWTPKATNTHTRRIYNNYSFSTATMVEITRLNVALYVHGLSCNICIYIFTYVSFNIGYYILLMLYSEMSMCGLWTGMSWFRMKTSGRHL